MAVNNDNKALTLQDYVVVVPVEFYQTDIDIYACESAFVAHLKTLKNNVGLEYRKMLIVAPRMPDNYYKTNAGSLSTINTKADGIQIWLVYPGDTGRLKYLLKYVWIVIPKLWLAVKRSSMVHSGPSHNVFQPFEIIAIVFSIIMRKRSIFVVDIDERNSAAMLYAIGSISKKSYLLMRYLYDPLLSLQIKLASRFCSLCLLKGQSMVDKYGKGPNVKNFLDTAHSVRYVLSDEQLKAKIMRFKSASKTINIAYFGRLTKYKGIADMLLAISDVIKYSDLSPRFTIIGDGEQRIELEDYTKMLNLNDNVIFAGALPYGKILFKCLYNQDILLAAPQREDTPRNLFDGMAAGLITVAYDTYYYVDMAKTGAIITVPWRDTHAMAKAIIKCAGDRQKHSFMLLKARDFALNNTQEIWLKKRLGWMRDSMLV